MAVPVNSTIQTQIANLYIAILGRNPEPAGFGYWCDTLANNNGTQAALNNITIGFSNSPEFIATYGGQTTSAAITLMYQNVLNRAPDATGLTYWTGVAQSYVNAGYTNAQALALTGNSLITLAAANTGTADQTLIQGKQTAAIASGTTAPTTTYTLTTSIETVNLGASGNAEGVINGASGTYQTGDTINGGSTTGANNVNVTIAAASGEANGPLVTLNNIGSANFRTLAAAPINATLFTNVGTIAAANSTNVLTVNSGALATTYALRNTVAGNTDGLAVGLRAGDITGTSNTINFSVSSVGTASTAPAGVAANIVRSQLSTTVSGIENIAIATTGTNFFTFTGNTAAATDSVLLTITGAGTNNIAIGAGGLATTSTINAATATGTLTLNVGTGLTTGDTIVGGTGTSDTLQATTAGTVATGLAISAIETLRLDSGANSTLAFATAPNFTTVRIDTGTAGTKTLSNIGDFKNLNFVGTGTTAAAASQMTFNGVVTTGGFAGAADSVAINIGNGGITNTNAAPYVNGAINIAGAETLAVTYADNTASTNAQLAGLTSSTLQSVTFAGSANVTGVGGAGNQVAIDTGIATTNSISSINLSGITATGLSEIAIGGTVANILAPAVAITAGVGGLTAIVNQVEVNTDVLTFTGGNGADTLTSNGNGTTFAGSVIFTGGAGNDAVNLGRTGTTVASANLTGGLGNDTYTLVNVGTVTINDLGGSDVLAVSADTGVVTSTVLTATVTANWTTANTSSFVDGGAGAGTLTVTLNLAAGVSTVNLATLNNASTNGVTINAANAGVSTTLTGTGAADTITGSALADTITGGLGADTLTGGAGVDTFVFTSGLTLDTVTDFGAAAGEVAQFGLTALNTANATLALTTLTVSNGLGVGVAAGSGISFLASTGATTLTSANVLNITGTTFAALANVDTALEAGGVRALTTAAGAAMVNKALLVQWQDNAGQYHLSIANISNTAAGTAVAANGIDMADIAIVGTTALTTANIGFIA